MHVQNTYCCGGKMFSSPVFANPLIWAVVFFAAVGIVTSINSIFIQDTLYDALRFIIWVVCFILCLIVGLGIVALGPAIFAVVTLCQFTWHTMEKNLREAGG